MKIGIVGCGLIGQKRALAARGHEVAIVADKDEARARALASSVPRARTVTDWRVLLDSEVELVVIATPHDQLAPIALACVESGRHILIEKPGARNARELLPVVEAVRRKGIVAKVGYNHRFHPSFQKAKEIVDRGALGPLFFVRGRYGHGGRPEYEKEWRCDREVSGGGELIDQGSHLIDLARWFLGDFPEVWGTAPTYYWKTPVDDNCFLALRTERNQTAWLHASWTEWKNLFSFEIAGRDGKLEINGLGGSYGVERLTHYHMLPGMGPPETTTWEYPFPDRSFEAEFEELTAAIQARRRPTGDIEDALAVLTVIDRVYGGTNRDHHP